MITARQSSQHNYFDIGNAGSRSSNTIKYPALHPNVICVGGCDPDGNLVPTSARGKEVAFLCPGAKVISTCNMSKYHSNKLHTDIDMPTFNHMVTSDKNK